VYKTKSVGNGAIDIRYDGKVCAVGGWDGKIRLYSTKKGKSLGTLRYHRTSCQTVAFAHHYPESILSKDDSDHDRKLEIRHWLIAGGKDGRISIWNLSDLGRS
jgi:ASTRA-associated protein 1